MVEDQIVNPYSVQSTSALNYEKIINQFGCEPIGPLKESLPNMHLLNRDIVFAHRDLQSLHEMDFYLYTGRGPSSESMHLGHTVPFTLTKKLQDHFSKKLVIQITDDEKFLCRGIELSTIKNYALENIKDIIAMDLDRDRTFIFLNSEYKYFDELVLRIAQRIRYSEIEKIFGFDRSTNIGLIQFPARQIAPAYFSAFPFLERSKAVIPAAIDQDPFFRLARDKANALKFPKPISIYSKFLPGLSGEKMSSSTGESIFLTDEIKNISKKIMGAKSGGRETLMEHRRLGAVLEDDIPYEYLKFFLEDENRYKQIGEDYSSGQLLSGEVKSICIKVISSYVEEYQERRSKVTQRDIERYMEVKK